MNLQFGLVPNGAGGWRRGAVLVCGHCGVKGTVGCNTFKGGNESEEKFIFSRLEASGWKIGKRDNQHRCPKCFTAIKVTAKQKQAEKKMTTIANIAKPPAAEMSREDRRIIFEKLNEVYADEKTGYTGDWTDAKLASDLGVARVWVSKVRDEMFGPEGGNENIRRLVEEGRNVLSECRKAAEIFAPLLGRAEKIERMLVEIERGLR